MKIKLMPAIGVLTLASCTQQLGEADYKLHLNQPLGPFQMGSEGEACKTFGYLPIVRDGKQETLMVEPKGEAVTYQISSTIYKSMAGLAVSVGCTSGSKDKSIVMNGRVDRDGSVYVFYIDKPLTEEQQQFLKGKEYYGVSKSGEPVDYPYLLLVVK